MKLNKFFHFFFSATLVVAVGSGSVSANDTEIYLNSSSSSGSSNILFSLDTSGSMGNRVDENNNGVIDSGERTRIEVLKVAMDIVLDSLPSLNAGLMRYHYYGGPILYPVADIDAEACTIEGNCTTGTAAGGTISVTSTLSSDDDDVEQEGAIAPLVMDRVALDMGQRAAGTCSTVSASVRVSTGGDDAESDNPGSGYTSTSTDLEIPREGSQQQIVGLRFQTVSIPAGATVTAASIEFEIDDVPSPITPIDILIVGEGMAGGRGGFSFGSQPEGRLVNATTAVVNWETGESPTVNEKLETNNISAILNEYVADPLWPAVGGADMVFILSKDPTATVDGTRIVESQNGEPGAAPLLKYTYQTCTTGGPVEMRTGLRFTDVGIPQGSTITSARIDFTATTAAGAAPNLQVQMQNADDAEAFASGTTITSRSFVSGPPGWNATSTPVLDDPWAVDTVYSTPDLTAMVQSVVNRTNWCGGNAMMFMVERIGGAAALRTAYSMEGDSTKAPVLSITYDADTPQAGANGCTRSTIVKTVTASNNDAEEAADGTVSTGSSDLELVQDASTQTIGVRFTDIPIGQGTTISDAKLVFTADETDTGGTTLTFNGELNDDADPFSSTNNDISSTTNRPRTTASVAYAAPNWSVVGQTHEVTGLGPIVQEIVNQAGWDAGNALAFIITGSGKRVADSYDGDPATAPRLVVTFEGDPVTSKVTVRKRLKDLVAGLIQASGTPISGAMLEAAYYFRGEGVRFGRQRGTQASGFRVSSVSHAASYNANGATVTYPGSCSTDNELHDDCKTQVISGGNPIYKSPIIAECQANYLVQLTDGGGYYTGEGLSNTLGQSIDEDNLINAFTAEDDNGNPVTMPACATDTVLPDGTTYSGSSHNECTVKLAQFLHDNDQIFSGTQNLQTGTAPIAGTQSLDIYNIGFNLCGTGNVTSLSTTGEQVCCAVANHNTGTGVCSSPVTDPDRIKVLKAQSAVAGGEYFNANTVDELVAAFTAITSNILEKSTSFVAPSIAANAFNRLFSRDEVYFGLFEPSKQQRWDGNVKKYKICVDTDPDGDGTADCTLGDVLDDTGAAAIVDDPTAIDDGLFKTSAESVWSGLQDGRETKIGGAGAEITDYTTRTVYTDVNAAVGQAALGTALNASGYLLNSGNWDATALSAVRDQVCPDPTVITAGSDCEARMLWMLGFDQFNEDDDVSTDTRWWFHDVLHSSPTVITYGKTSGGVFIDKLLVGTNDGGLHFINGTTGVEEWVFMPNALLADQQTFYDNSAPEHTYGLDGSPVIGVFDANLDGTIDPANDFVGAIINQRRGGDNMYALNLTPTSTLTSTTTAIVPKFLWQINSSTSGFSRLGQTWSEPVITNISITGGNTREVIIFGGGYDTDLDSDDGSGNKNFGTEAGDPNRGNAIYVADAATGALIFSISGSGSGADIEVPALKYAIPSNIATLDTDGDGNDDRLFVGDTGGQVIRVDLINVNPSSGTDPEGDTVVGILANVSVAGTIAKERRFFYKPTVVQVIDKTYSSAAGGEYDYVLIGTGNRANPLDNAVGDRFYAFRDINTGTMVDTDGNNIADNYPLNADGTTNGGPIPENSSELLDVSSTTLDALGATSSAVQNALGWYIDFNALSRPGEKVLAASGVFAGTLIFTTYVPDDPAAISDVCSAAEGSGRAYNLNILSTAAALDWDEDGTLESTADRSVALGSGIPSSGVPIFTAEGVTVLVGTGGGSENLDKVADRPRVRTFWTEEK